MTEEATHENTGPDDRASQRYEIVVTSAPIPERWLRWLGFLIIGIVTLGAAAVIPGGQRIRVKDRASGATVATLKQGFGNDDDVAAHLKGQLATLSVEEFENEWVERS